MSQPLPESYDNDGEEVCWICLVGAMEEAPLEYPCSCPRLVHKACLARWQLQSAGRREDVDCRFCKKTLPDWREHFKPKDVTPKHLDMSVFFNGKVHKVTVYPGHEGRIRFQNDVRCELKLRDDQMFNIDFECDLPGSDDKVELKGLNSCDAAVFCASITAGQRKVQDDRKTCDALQSKDECGSRLSRIMCCISLMLRF
jgi:hypothetical protein